MGMMILFFKLKWLQLKRWISERSKCTMSNEQCTMNKGSKEEKEF